MREWVVMVVRCYSGSRLFRPKTQCRLCQGLTAVPRGACWTRGFQQREICTCIHQVQVRKCFFAHARGVCYPTLSMVPV